MKLSNLFSKFSSTPPERAVYSQIVSLARQKWLYLNAGVPDTVTGRFHMITLHSFLVLEHLGGKGEAEAKFAQDLFDEMFMDMDHSLREMGVGDLSVGKKVRKMSESYYGACNAYRKAFAQPQDKLQNELTAALKRNVTGDEVSDQALENLTKYAQLVKTGLQDIQPKSILAGKLSLPEVTGAIR